VDPAKVTLKPRRARREKTCSVTDFRNGDTRRKTNHVKQLSSSVSMIWCHISEGRTGGVGTPMTSGPTPGVCESRETMGARNNGISAMESIICVWSWMESNGG
jgi:hypothetical protein